jgi:hypothetical protein
MITKLFGKILNFLKKDNSISYYPRKYYYESMIDKYKDLSAYYNLELVNTKKSLFTNKAITLIKGQKFNLKRKQIIENFGKPRVKFRIREQSLIIDILIYKIYLGEYPIRLEIHMNKGNLYYYKYTFISKQTMTSEDKQKIISIIQDKYLQGSQIDIATQNIINKHKKVLQVEDDVNFKIYYMDLSSITFQRLSAYKQKCENKIQHKSKIKHKELIEKL